MTHAPKCYKPGCTKPCRPKTFNDGVAAEYWPLCEDCYLEDITNSTTKRFTILKVPELFRDTDPERLSLCLAEIARTWEPNKRGLLIHGSTRKGKTRAAWYIAQRLNMKDAIKNKCLFLTMFELEARLIASWGKESWDSEMRRMTQIPLLFLDDMGKEKMTDRMASVLFALIDERTMSQKPTVITTNLTGETLLGRFHDKEVGVALVARLKDKDLFEVISASENL